MKGKTLAISAALMVLLTGGWLGLQKTPAVSDTAGKLLLPALQGRTERITQIEVMRPNEPLLKLAKKGDHWQLPLPEQADKAYPAAVSTVGSLLRALVEAKTVEAKTRRAEQHARLNLAEQGEGGATRIRLEFKGAPALELLVGKAAQQGDGQLVRLASDNQVWLIDQGIPLPQDTFLGWINRRISSIPADEIKAIELSFTEEQDGYKSLQLSRDKADEPFKVKPAGDTAMPAVQDASARLSRLFAALNLSEVKTKLPEDSTALLDFSISGFEQERLTGKLFQQKSAQEGPSGAYWLSFTDESNAPAAWLPAGRHWVWRIEDFAGQTLFEALPKALTAKAESE
ncbi:hypothetical protein AXE65_11740 [Ventosimonas gracilis]|uniref:DUF4340 domain-containing protein n=1 Tax=Ventosimonas gracilis TaxID=1680762 RepID=A0A139SW72_9GAMM|nr:DUF4340 domain-containing protein [Ventosimonas gracilis]KXU38857.1 hypothetical protein AXE65_11740 [Ventosimonas gracilis]